MSEQPITHRRLAELASIIRSKNAGPFRLTFDILFDEEETFQGVVATEAITSQSVAALLSVPEDRISSIHVLPFARAIKITLFRPLPQCAAGERDVYGCQQHTPLMELLVPVGGNYLPRLESEA